jgi:transposase
MEDILSLYEREYAGDRPVVCFDERPCQLREGQELPARQGSGVRRVDSHYRRNGTCCVLLAVEPRRGRRITEVQPHRGAKEYARFLRRLAGAYPEAERIVLVQDNLSTHHMGSLYETFSAEEARKLAERFEVHYTPKKASWLNMAEIEFSAMTKQCLDRRIGSIGLIRQQLRIWNRRRNREGAKIRWVFCTTSARRKLSRHYEAVRN